MSLMGGAVLGSEENSIRGRVKTEGALYWRGIAWQARKSGIVCKD